MPLTEKDQLFITLLRLSRGFNLYTSAHFYSVSESYIRKMFTTWIAFLYYHFKDLKEVMLPVRDVFQHVKPKVFKNFKNIRCSVDFTEFFCEVPRNYAQQGNIIYSAYKYIYISCNWNFESWETYQIKYNFLDRIVFDPIKICYSSKIKSGPTAISCSF